MGRQPVTATFYLDSTCALRLNRALIDHQPPPLTLVAADNDLLKAAQTEGLETENPNLRP